MPDECHPSSLSQETVERSPPGHVKSLENFTFSNSNGKLDFSDRYLMERPKETVNSRWMVNTGFSSESGGISKIRNYRDGEKQLR